MLNTVPDAIGDAIRELLDVFAQNVKETQGNRTNANERAN